MNLRLFGRTRAYAVMLFVTFCLGSAASSFGAGTEAPCEILVLHSYHHGLVWTDSITEGIQAGFADSELDVRLNIEYMDTKRHDPNDFAFPHLQDLYAAKFKNIRFDLIIAADNNAFGFLQRTRRKLFDGIPIVFCGLDDFKDKQIEGMENITGVNERHEMHGTIDLALRFHPKTKRIAVINDETPSGVILQQQVDKMIAAKEYPVRFDNLIGLPAEELAQALRDLPENAIILHLSYSRDRNDRPYELQDSIDLLTENCDLPVYTCWDWRIGKGVIGGIVTDGRSQGLNATRKAVEILRGTPADSVSARRTRLRGP